MPAVDELVELLRDVEQILYDRREDIPKSIEVMITYCENNIKNNFELSHFNAYFESCRADLVRLSSGGYIWFNSAAERDKSLDRLDTLAERIRNPAAEVVQPKPKGLGRLFGFLTRRNTAIQKAEKLKPKKELKGLEGYRIWCESLLREFEAKFNSTNPESTKYIYQTAKRIERILLGSLQQCLFHGGFEKRGSGLTGRGNKEHRNKWFSFYTNMTYDLIKSIDDCQNKIRSRISAKIISSPNNEILPLQVGMEPGVGVNDFPFVKFYMRQLQSIFSEAEELLYPIVSTKVSEAIIMQDDLRKIKSIYWTLSVDRKLWLAFYEDCSSRDWEIYDFSALNNYDFITYRLISKICDEYERAFSLDHLSESDKGIAFILGAKIDPDDIRADFDKKVTTSIPQGFKDTLGYFNRLGITPQDLDGKSEIEIRKRLKYNYYTFAKQCHPDIHPGDREKEQQFKELSEAYEVLSNPTKRKEYLRL